MRTLLECAKEAALAGGKELIARRADMGAVRSKGWSTDFVTEADLAAGVAVARAIIERFPEARFVIEEDEVYDLGSRSPRHA